LKRTKSLALLLVMALISGLFTVPPGTSIAVAASEKPNLLQGVTLTKGQNVKVRSENSTRKAHFLNLTDGTNFWQMGGNATNMFNALTGTGSMWAAVDLGAEQNITEVSFDIFTGGYDAIATRISGYQVLYSSDANVWNSLPSEASNLDRFDWDSAGWKMAKHISMPASKPPSDPNWDLTTVPYAGQTPAPTTTGEFDSPVPARYVLIHYDVTKTSNTIVGGLGMGNLKIFGAAPEVPAGPTIAPAEGAYTKGLGVLPQTTVTLNGAALTGIYHNTVAENVYLNEGADYTVTDAVYGVQMTVQFTANFLNSLPEGDSQFTFQFHGGHSLTYGLQLSTPPYADQFLNKPGNGFAIITPDYPGMSLTIGRPAVIDVSALTNKFPVLRVSHAVNGTEIAGSIIGPNGSAVHQIQPVLVNENGSAVIAIPDSVPLVKGTYKAALTLTNNGSTLHDSYYFTAIDHFLNYYSNPNLNHSNNANVANVHPDSWANDAYPAVQLGQDGKLVYIPDYKGNQILDHSMVGYKGGAEAIPNVPVRVRVSPLADDTQDAWQLIQDAIHYVSRYPVQEDGFRGAVYLEPGVFRISQPLQVETSGVVIRGAGAGEPIPVKGSGTVEDPYYMDRASQEAEAGVTKLVATWKLTTAAYTPSDNHTTHKSNTSTPYGTGSSSSMIYFNGGGLEPTNVTTTVTDQYVGAGQNVVHVASVEGFAVGDLVIVQKTVNPDWVRALYMDRVDGDSNWLPGGNLETGFAGNPFASERYIRSIDPIAGTITFEESLSDNLDLRWGVPTIVKMQEGGRISHVGVENIQAISHFESDNKPELERFGANFKLFNDENHAQVFVLMNNVRDGWLRNFTTYHVDTGFATRGESRNITVQDGNVLDPVSMANSGSRRYSIYYNKSEYMLTNRIHSRYSRHAFIVDSYTTGPNVFYNSTSEWVTTASEPHFRWSSGGLYDNVLARIQVQNRWDWGTSHGWSGVNYVLYNTEGPFIVTQPQLAPVYLIGHHFDQSTNTLGYTDVDDLTTGRRSVDKKNSANMSAAGLNGGQVPNFEAYEYSITRLVTPELDHMPKSLYLQQLIDRQGPEAAERLVPDTVPPMIDHSSNDRPKLISLTVDGVEAPDFSPEKNSYTITPSIDYDYTKDIVIRAKPEDGATMEIKYLKDGMEAEITLTDPNGVKNFYIITFDVIKKSPIVYASGQQVDGNNSNYAVNVLNPADYAGTTSLRWAADNLQWIRMYLGASARTLEGVQIGFLQHTSNSRTYKLRIETSIDGQNWSVVPSGTVTSNTTTIPETWSASSESFIHSLTLNGPSAGPAANTLQTFTFDTPVEARLFRIVGSGNITGTSSSPWNNYWRLRPVFQGTEQAYTPPTGVTIAGSATVTTDRTLQLTAHVAPAAATITDVIWSSSNPAVASVDSRGQVSGIQAGTAVITATTADGTFISTGLVEPFTATHHITVVNPTNDDDDYDDAKPGSPSSATEAVKTSIPAGHSGELSLGNQVLITVPAQASDKDLLITIGKVVDTQSLISKDDRLVSEVYEILKNVKENFKQPITLTLRFDPTAIQTNQKAAVFYYDEVKREWVEVTGGKIDGNQISVAVDHFTKFAVFAVSKAAETPASSVNLKDISNHWAEKNIQEAVGKGIVNGYQDGTFRPNQSVTRAEFAVMLMNSLQPQGEGATLTFADTGDIGGWAQKAVAQAVQAGIVQGYEDGSFRPNAQITRAEMAVMLAKAAGLKVEATAETGFDDESEVPVWSKGAVAALKQQKLIEGKSGNEFAPAGLTTRAEAVTVLLKMLALKH
jgi:uncharacterized protein YjdB